MPAPILGDPLGVVVDVVQREPGETGGNGYERLSSGMRSVRRKLILQEALGCTSGNRNLRSLPCSSIMVLVFPLFDVWSADVLPGEVAGCHQSPSGLHG